jgi:hypothetical protein
MHPVRLLSPTHPQRPRQLAEAGRRRAESGWGAQQVVSTLLAHLSGTGVPGATQRGKSSLGGGNFAHQASLAGAANAGTVALGGKSTPRP